MDMKNPFGVEAISTQLRAMSILIDEQHIQASFAPSDCPLVDLACQHIRYGGDTDSACLASLLYTIAENLQA